MYNLNYVDAICFKQPLAYTFDLSSFYMWITWDFT
jgi:hypothetical protein